MKELIRPNGFGPFYCEGQEILRQIFVSVRDRHWREISPTEWNCSVHEARREIGIVARHVSELVDFAWAGTLEVNPNGRTLRFSFEGKAKRPMEICRLGLIVLHPVDATRGAQMSTRGPEGAQSVIVSEMIAPQPIVDGYPRAMTPPFDSLTLARADIGRLELKFGGDLFEIEDQRNWGDASFKTYCTPLKMGFPRRVESGTHIAHRLDVEFSPAARLSAATQDRFECPRGTFPPIGCERSGRSVTEAAALHWHHVHIDPGELPAGEALTQAADVPLEIGVDSVGCEDPPPALLSWIYEHRGRVARLLLYGPEISAPSLAVLDRWRRVLDDQGDEALPLFAAVRGYFLEFNRGTGEPQGAIGLAFPLTATVHANDPMTIAENVATIADIAQTARHTLRATALAVSPIALYHPVSARSDSFPDALVAPWLAATLLHAAVAGVASVTLASDVITQAPTAILRRLLQCTGSPVTLLPQAPNASVHAATLHQEGTTMVHLLAVNLSASPAPLDLGATLGRIHSLAEIRDREVSPIAGTGVELTAFGVHWFRCALV